MRRAIFVVIAFVVLVATGYVVLSYDAIAPEAPVGQSPTETPTPTPTPTPTSPTKYIPMRFAAIGDFGTGEATQLAVAQRMCNWRKKHPFDLVFTSGDNIYPDGSPHDFYDHFREPYRCLRRKGVDFHVSLGNHDYMTDQGRPEIERKDLFGMKGRNYVVRQGGVRFVLWDTNTMDKEWLKDALKTGPDNDWTIVLFHYPVYSPGTVRGSYPGLADEVADLFARRGVDLVINGHDHLYAVSKPLRKIRYAVTGGGGAPLYTCGDASFKDRCEEIHHFLYVVTHRNYIHVHAVPIEGEPFDKFRAYGRD